MPERPEIRAEFSRLIAGEIPIDRIDSYELLTNSGFKIISDFKNKQFSNQIENNQVSE